MSDEFCKMLNEDSHKHATLPESQRYGVHFEYQDLVNRLNKVKKERERKSYANSSLEFPEKHNEPQLKLRQEKKHSTITSTEKLMRHTSVGVLPDIKTPRPKIKPKYALPVQSETNLQSERAKKTIKLHPLAKRPSLHF